MKDFSNIKVGDRLFLRFGNFGQFELATVAKVHKNYFVDSYGHAWNMPTGWRRGGERWDLRECEIYDPNNPEQQRLIAIKRRKVIRDQIQDLLPKVDDESRLRAALSALEATP